MVPLNQIVLQDNSPQKDERKPMKPKEPIGMARRSFMKTLAITGGSLVPRQPLLG
jgi:hypothetical protein